MQSTQKEWAAVASALDALGPFPDRARICEIVVLAEECRHDVGSAKRLAELWTTAAARAPPTLLYALLCVADALAQSEREHGERRGSDDAAATAAATTTGIEAELSVSVCSHAVSAFSSLRRLDQARVMRTVAAWVHAGMWGDEAGRALASLPHAIPLHAIPLHAILSHTIPPLVDSSLGGAPAHKRRRECLNLSRVQSPCLREGLAPPTTCLPVPPVPALPLPLPPPSSRLSELLARVRGSAYPASPFFLTPTPTPTPPPPPSLPPPLPPPPPLSAISLVPFFSAAEQALALAPGDLVHPGTTDISAATLALRDVAAVRLLIDCQPFKCDGPQGCGARFKTLSMLKEHACTVQNTPDGNLQDQRLKDATPTVWPRPIAHASRAYLGRADAWIAGKAPAALVHASSFELLEMHARAAETQAQHTEAVRAQQARQRLIPLRTSGAACYACGEAFELVRVSTGEGDDVLVCAADAVRATSAWAAHANDANEECFVHDACATSLCCC